jgi:hypothetical protein
MTYVDKDAALKADYADLGVTTGYIGNIYPGRDDRSFYVFTQARNQQTREMVGIHVFCVPRSHKGLWNAPVDFDTPAIRAKLDAVRAQVAAGKFHIVNR